MRTPRLDQVRFDNLPFGHVPSKLLPYMSVQALSAQSGGPVKHRILKIAALLFVLSALSVAQDVASFEKRITVKKLPNGLTLLICERPEAPVFAFFTMVDAGSVQDPMRATGLAHMFEHMAFKGT